MAKPDDKKLREILSSSKVIAVVGHSDKPYRTSYRIAQYLRAVGYKVYPVNPMVDEIDGEKSYPRLQAVPEPIDVVDVFRRREHLAGVVDDAIEANAKSVWGQLGVIDLEAGVKGEQAGLDMVMDLCIKIEHMRLLL